jgi:hypothetical protein
MMISKNFLVLVPSPAVRAMIQTQFMMAVIIQPAAVSFWEEGSEEGKRLLSMPMAARTVDMGRREVRRGVWTERE